MDGSRMATRFTVSFTVSFYSIILATEYAQEASHEVGIYEYEKAGDLCLFRYLNVAENNS
jgi:hypothetical protein